MKKTLVLILSAVFIAVSGHATGDDVLRSSEQKADPPLSISVEILPVEYGSMAGKFRCRAVVELSPGSGEVVTTEDILLEPGEKGERTVRHEDLQVTFAAEIGSEAKSARTVVTVKRGEEVVGRQASHVELNSPEGTVASADHQALFETCEPYRTEPEPGVSPARAIHREQARVPRSGPDRGVACFMATIDVNGRVADPRLVYTDHKLFARAFLEALNGWRFEPASRGGAPVGSEKMLSATFKRY